MYKFGKSERTKITRKLDSLVSNLVREKASWTCQRCHKKYEPKSRGLHCSHYFSRRYKGTRWDFSNLDALCMGCHKYVEGDKQGWYKDYMIKKLGESKLDLLRSRAYSKTKFSVVDLEWLYKKIKDEGYKM